MITIRLRDYPTGATLYVFPETKDVTNATDWANYKVLMTEAAGRYTASVDPVNGTNWVAFVGATQPSGWGDALAGVGWELLIEAIKADADLGTADGGLVSNAAMLGVAIDGYTFTEAQRLILAAGVSTISGGGTGTNVIYAADGSKPRITGTYDNLGNRTPTIIDAT